VTMTPAPPDQQLERMHLHHGTPSDGQTAREGTATPATALLRRPQPGSRRVELGLSKSWPLACTPVRWIACARCWKPKRSSLESAVKEREVVHPLATYRRERRVRGRPQSRRRRSDVSVLRRNLRGLREARRLWCRSRGRLDRRGTSGLDEPATRSQHSVPPLSLCVLSRWSRFRPTRPPSCGPFLVLLPACALCGQSWWYSRSDARPLSSMAGRNRGQ